MFNHLTRWKEGPCKCCSDNDLLVLGDDEKDDKDYQAQVTVITMAYRIM